MQTLFIDKKMKYDGSQLRSLYAYLDHRLLGPSIVSWIGPCDIPFEHMADEEDLLDQSAIRGGEMLHFIVEIFDRELFSGVSLQRLFASIIKDLCSDLSPTLKNTSKKLYRDGDDIFLDDQKLSISIAVKSPVSVMIHFAVNITNENTPVKTLSLGDLKIEARAFADQAMTKFTKEYQSITQATQKVRPLP